MKHVKRTLAKLCVLVAALATLATSPARWKVESSKGVTAELSDAKPVHREQVTVIATHRLDLELIATVVWPEAGSKGEVRVIARPDEGSPAVEMVALPSHAEAGVTPVRVAQARELPAGGCLSGCTRVYQIEIERRGGAGERAEVTLEVRAEVKGTGEQPAGAGVNVQIDRVL